MNLRRFVSFPDNHSQHKTTVCKKICGAFKDQHSSAISTDLTNSRQMELETTRICFKASFSKNLFADHKLKIRITFFLQTSQGQHHKHLNNKDWKKAKSLLTLSEAHWQLTTVRSILCSFQVPHKYHSSSYSYHISVGNILMTLEAPAFKTKKIKHCSKGEASWIFAPGLSSELISGSNFCFHVWRYCKISAQSTAFGSNHVA